MRARARDKAPVTNYYYYVCDFLLFLFTSTRCNRALTSNKLAILYLTVVLRSTAHQNQGDAVHSFGWLEARTHSRAIVQSKVNRNEVLKYLSLRTQYLHKKMNINTINIYFHSFNSNNICSINQINSTQCSVRCAMYRFEWLGCHFLSPSLSFASFNFDCCGKKTMA